jgi:hypothetical protein
LPLCAYDRHADQRVALRAGLHKRVIALDHGRDHQQGDLGSIFVCTASSYTHNLELNA